MHVHDVEASAAHESPQAHEFAQTETRVEREAMQLHAKFGKVLFADLPAVVRHDDDRFEFVRVETFNEAAQYLSASAARRRDHLQDTLSSHASPRTRARHSSNRSRRLCSNEMRGCQPEHARSFVASPI